MTAIYHITHTDNLPQLFAQGGLWCDNERQAHVPQIVGIAHQHIKDRRARKVVSKCRQGTLADYVPFYFAPRSPMLYAISRGNVQRYNGTQQNVVHLVSSAAIVEQNSLPFCFTDGHAEMDFSQQFDNLSDLNQVDWKMMQERYWSDTKEDGDRTRRRQAEFLVHRFFPVTLFSEISVMTLKSAEYIKSLFPKDALLPQITIHREWYY